MKITTEKKEGVRIPRSTLMWFLSLTLLLAACGGSADEQDKANAEAARASLPRIENPTPIETEEPERPAVNLEGTKPAPIIRSTPQLVQPPEDPNK